MGSTEWIELLNIPCCEDLDNPQRSAQSNRKLEPAEENV